MNEFIKSTINLSYQINNKLTITDIKSYTIIKNINKEIDNQHALSIFKKSFYDPQTTSILLISRNIPVIYAYYNEFLFNRDKDNRV